jgi:hypothetical protein
MFWNKLSAIIIATSFLAGGEAFAKKRHNHDHDHTKRRPTIQRRTTPVADEKYEYKVTKLPNGRIKIDHYYKTLEKNPHEVKFTTIHGPKSALDALAKAKTRATKALNDKKVREAKARAQSQTAKEKSKDYQKKVAAKKKAAQKKLAKKKQELRKKAQKKKAIARKKQASRSVTRSVPSNNLNNHVWTIKDLGNGTVQLSHRVDQELECNGRLLQAKMPGKPVHYILKKADLDAELKRQQDAAKREPRPAPIRARTTKRSLLDDFLGRKRETVVVKNPNNAPKKKKENRSWLSRLFGNKKKNK